MIILNANDLPYRCHKCGNCDLEPQIDEGKSVPSGFKCTSCATVTSVKELFDMMPKGKHRPSYYNLSNHQEHAIAIGLIVAGWAMVEGILSNIAQAMLRGPYWQTDAVFHALPNSRSRLNILQALSEKMDGRRSFRTRLLLLLTQAGNTLERRNKFAHGVWHMGVDPKEVYLLESQGTPQRQHRKVQPKELQEVAAEIGDLYEKLRAFFNDYNDAHPVPMSLVMESPDGVSR